MYIPPIDPRDHAATRQPTWRNVLVAYALLAAVALSLWVVSNPVAGAVLVVAIAGLAVGGHRAVELGRCLVECREFAVDLVGDVRVTVTKNPAGNDFTERDSAEATQATSCC